MRKTKAGIFTLIALIVLLIASIQVGALIRQKQTGELLILQAQYEQERTVLLSDPYGSSGNQIEAFTLASDRLVEAEREKASYADAYWPAHLFSFMLGIYIYPRRRR